MMFFEVKVLNNVKRYSFYSKNNTSLLIARKESFDILDNSFFLNKITGYLPYSHYSFENIILLQKSNGQGIEVYKNESLAYEIAGNFYLWKRCKCQNELYFSGKENSKRTIFSLDCISLDLSVSSLPSVPFLGTKNGLLIFNIGNEVRCCDEKYNEIWQIDVSKLGKWTVDGYTHHARVNQIIEDKNSGLLIFSVIAFHIIGVSVDTGKIVWERKFPGGENNMSLFGEKLFVISFAISPVYYVIDIKNGKTISEVHLGDAWKTFAALDSKSGKEVHFHWFMTQHTIDEKYLYVAGRDHKEIGVFNRDTAELIQMIPLKSAVSRIPASYAPKVKNNFIYQLDGDETLHIFKRNA